MSESEFLGQRKDERVIGIFRKHLVVAKRGIIALVLGFAIGIIPVLLWGTGWTGWFFVICFLAGLVYAGYQYILWYYTMFVLTNERLRVIQQKGFFRRRTTDLELRSVVSVSVDTPNLFGVIFKYGTLNLQSSVGDMTIFYMNNPEKVCAELQNTIADLEAVETVKPKRKEKPTKEKLPGGKQGDEPRGEIIFEDDERMIV